MGGGGENLSAGADKEELSMDLDCNFLGGSWDFWLQQTKGTSIMTFFFDGINGNLQALVMLLHDFSD